MSVFMRSADASGAVVAVKVSNELNFSGNATVTTAASLRRHVHVEAVAKNERISKNNSNLRKTVVPPILAVQLVIEFGDFAG